MIELGPRSDERMRAALAAIWSHPDLEGGYLHHNVEPDRQPRVRPGEVRYDQGEEMLGVATVPGGVCVACKAFAFVPHEGGSDWVGLFFPYGALESIYPVNGYPIGNVASREWREPLDAWLVELARRVFAVVPYQFGIIDYEIVLEVDAADVLRTGIPEDRWSTYLWREGEVLACYPPTRYDGE